LVCRRCNRVTDIDHPTLNKIAMPNLGGIDFEVMDYSIHLEGLCGEMSEERVESERTKT